MDLLINIIIWTSVLGLFISGLIITFLNLPGVWLIFIGILISAIHTGFDEVSFLAVLFFLIISILVSLSDNLIIPISTKYTGGSNWAVVGAVIGGIVGLIFGGIIGAILGPFIGAVLFEFIFATQQIKKALKAGFGTFIGFFSTIIIKFSAAVAMIFLWIVVRFYI